MTAKLSLCAIGVVAVFCAPDLFARGKWVTFENCTLIANPANDGDSFHVRVKRKEYIFRLYYVDTPETEPGLRERLDEQAKYFGITIEQTLQVGEVAKQFTAEKLSRPFKVETCKEDALGRSKRERFYAFIQTAGGDDLAEKLVENGLARIHGASGTPVGLPRVDKEWSRLQQMQVEARDEKVGGWGVNFNRMTTRSAREGGHPYDSFKEFFHKANATPEPSVEAAAIKLPQPPPKAASSTSTPPARNSCRRLKVSVRRWRRALSRRGRSHRRTGSAQLKASAPRPTPRSVLTSSSDQVNRADRPRRFLRARRRSSSRRRRCSQSNGRRS